MEESSSSEVAYSSLDSCNTLSGGTMSDNEEKSFSNDIDDLYFDKYDNGFPDTDLIMMNKLNQEVYGKNNHVIECMENFEPLPKISSIKLEKMIKFEFERNVYSLQKQKQNINIINLIMKFFHPIQEITVYFVTLNGLITSNMKKLTLKMYKNDTISNLQKNIALKFDVNADQLILCEFWKSILTKLKYEYISMISIDDQIIAYYMPSYVDIKCQLFDSYNNIQLSYTSLVHQCHNFIDDDEQSLSSLHFQSVHYPYFERTPSKITRNVSLSMSEYEHSVISELSNDLTLTNPHNASHFVIPPPIDENDSLSDCDHYDHFEQETKTKISKISINNNSINNESNDFVNVGIPIPLMLPKNTIISTQVIIKQCEMILSPYLQQWQNNKLSPYQLYILTKNTIYCGICADNAFCRGCKLNKYQEINTKDLDFIISIRWIDEDSFNSFDQTVFTLNQNQIKGATNYNIGI